MGALEIKKYPEVILRQECEAVEKILEEELQLFQDMLLTMHNAQGIGLAAPQVGIKKKILVIDIGEGPIKLANPQLIKVNDVTEVMGEGCLSVPDAVVDVERPTEVIVEGLNEAGKTVEIKAEGLLARVLLHELDHLNGKLIIDYMSFLKKLDYKLKVKNNRAG